mmetsp:Transcript_57175/g.93079  ORF Transcript_57175/g.93079 Transcript_57175/m.93079 type:complete len:217 (-) Transcript_57175:17-667(-)
MDTAFVGSTTKTAQHSEGGNRPKSQHCAARRGSGQQLARGVQTHGPDRRAMRQDCAQGLQGVGVYHTHQPGAGFQRSTLAPSHKGSRQQATLGVATKAAKTRVQTWGLIRTIDHMQHLHGLEIENVNFLPQQNNSSAVVHLHTGNLTWKLQRADSGTSFGVPHGELTPQVIADQCHQRSAKEHLDQFDHAAVLTMKEGSGLCAEDVETSWSPNCQA